MPSRLTERSRVKDLINIARADTMWDELLSGMIEQASEEVESITQRSFAKQQRTEFHQSYEQSPADPTHQSIFLNAWPVDTSLLFEIVYSPDARHDTNGLKLATEDYRVDADHGVVAIYRMSGLIGDLLLTARTLASFIYSPTGFKVTYTGGYTVNTIPASPISPDPIDDYDVVQVPLGLKTLIAQKVADDWREKKAVTPWKEEQLTLIHKYRQRS